MSEFRRRLIRQNVWFLPKEYQRVESISSGGKQIITLNYIVHEDDEIYLEYYIGAIVGDQHYYQTSDGEYGLWQNFAPGAFYFRFGSKASQIVYAVEPKKGYSLLRKNEVIVNDMRYSIYPYVSAPQYPLNIFAGKRINGEVYSYATYTLYAFNIKRYGKTIIELIPCYRKSDKEIGLYDIVNDIFYTNQGSGQFTKGNDL